jgi:hypothetical protein
MEWDLLNNVSRRALEPLAIALLCFGIASALISFQRLYRRDLEAQLDDQRRLLSAIRKLIERSAPNTNRRPSAPPADVQYKPPASQSRSQP